MTDGANSQSFSFRVSNKPMGGVAPLTKGAFKEIFEDHSFSGELERIVLEFTVRQRNPEIGLATPELGSADAPPFWYMPITYKAYGRPKQFLLWKLANCKAETSLNMAPGHFNGQYVSAEGYVDFVVHEAEGLAKAFGLQAKIVYHGDPFYARKYLPKPQQQQPQQQKR